MMEVTGFAENENEIFDLDSNEHYGLAIMTHLNQTWNCYIGTFDYLYGILTGTGLLINDEDNDDEFINHVLFKLKDNNPIKVINIMRLTAEQAKFRHGDSETSIKLNSLSLIENRNVDFLHFSP